jgi:hypothetical protein
VEFVLATIKVIYKLKNNIGKKVKSSLILRKTKVERGKIFYFSLKNNNI